MSRTAKHLERHYTDRIGWLRAAVLGANDGIVSTASLIVGVAAANTPKSGVLIAGVSGLVAGAMSMAAGEYVSVSSQADTERADLEREQRELETDRYSEREELANIYINRGLTSSLAQQVATQLMAHDALSAHARDELGLSDIHQARPVQAAIASSLTFSCGAALPLVLVALSPMAWIIPAVAISSLLFLALLGGIAAQAGGAKVVIGIARVTLLGALAMALTTAIGTVFGSAV